MFGEPPYSAGRRPALPVPSGWIRTRGGWESATTEPRFNLRESFRCAVKDGDDHLPSSMGVVSTRLIFGQGASFRVCHLGQNEIVFANVVKKSPDRKVKLLAPRERTIDG